MVEALIAATVAFIVLAAILHSRLYDIAKEVAGARQELARTTADFEGLRISFARIEATVSREINTQQDMRDDKVRAERRARDRELAERIAAGTVRIITD